MAKIEQKGKVSFGQALKDYFRGYVDFKGRTTRAGFWWVNLVLILLVIAFYIAFVAKFISSINSVIYGEPSFGGLIPLVAFAVIFWLALFLPSLALSIRRYRDAGMTGWGILVFYLFSIACGYTQFYSVFSSINFDAYGNTVSSSGGSPFFFFLSMVISLFFFLLSVFPSDMLTTKSTNSFMLFFFRKKEA